MPALRRDHPADRPGGALDLLLPRLPAKAARAAAQAPEGEALTEPPPPAGFAIGHWTDADGVTGCTAIVTPPGSRGGVGAVARVIA